MDDTADISHEPSDHVVSELGEVDHFDEEAMKNNIERLRDVHCGGDCSVLGFSLVEACKYQNRDSEQGRVALYLI